jgi:hypothetical protein
MKSICVFCGSSAGKDPAYRESALSLADIIVRQDLHLVYGGGSIGLMGILADRVLSQGGKVTGVIPKFLYDLEVGHSGVTELIIVRSMHERKEKMAELADAFLALPGGYGTLEEMAEIMTWIQLRIIQKPIGMLNIKGYFNHFLDQLDHMVEESFLNINNRRIIHASSSPGEIIKMLQNSWLEIKSKFMDKEKT